MLILLAGCTQESTEPSSLPSSPAPSEESMQKETFNLMEPVMDENNTSVTPLNSYVRLITAGGPAEEMAQEASDIIHEYHKLADSDHFYLDDQGERIHNIAWINEQEPDTDLSVSAEMAEMLKTALEYSRMTQGWFSPFLGSLSDLWKPRFQVPGSVEEDPSFQSVQEALACTVRVEDADSALQINERDHTIRLHQPSACNGRMKIDLGAMAKGYILDKVYEKLLEYRCPFLIDAGSSSIRFFADDPSVDWNIGVRGVDGGGMLFAFAGKTGSVATSGDDQQFCFVKQENGTLIRRHHIFNPFTGYSENHYRSLTLYAESEAGILDVLSTALFSIDDPDIREQIVSEFEKDTGSHLESAALMETSAGYELALAGGFQNRILEDSMNKDIKEKYIYETNDQPGMCSAAVRMCFCTCPFCSRTNTVS